MRIVYLSLVIIFLLFSCDRKKKANGNVINKSDLIYKGVFDETYYALGSFSQGQNDSVETGLWQYTCLAKPLVLYGNYSDGMPTGKWNFVFDNGTGLSSVWSVYKNTMASCNISIPFAYNETIMDSSFFKLTTVNDSLGKISVITGITDTVISDSNLSRFGADSESGLSEQGYTFTSTKKQIDKSGNRYFFGEYFMKNPLKKQAKLYNLYGYLPSKRRFVEFTVFHEGPKEELVKIIYNLMVTSLYVNGERFFNPYIK